MKKKLLQILILSTVLFITNCHATAQNPIQIVDSGKKTEIKQVEKISGSDPINLSDDLVHKSNFWLTIILVIFGLFIISITVLAMNQKSITVSASEYLRLVSITLIVIASLVLVVAGYSNSQISPVIGLLGTIAGYLLGKSDSVKTKKED